MASVRDRFFVEGVHAVGGRVVFAPDDARKIATVLRARSGEHVQVIDSAGTAYRATLDVHGNDVAATLDEELPRDAPAGRARITIAQAIPKGAKLDLIVEKATELGAVSIVPLRSARVVGERTGEHKRERWQRVAKAAAQQCGRRDVPEIGEIATWETLLPTFASYDRVYIPWELAPQRPLRAVLDADAPRARRVLFVIGPEGGFGADEVERATASGAIPVSLGARVLRTETVALVVLTAFAYAAGEI